MPKQNKAEIQQRLTAIQDWMMMDGMSSEAIVHVIQGKGWARTDRQAERLLQQARQLWLRFGEDCVEDKRRMKVMELKKHIRGLDDELRRTIAGMRIILAYEKEIIKLEGLYMLPARGRDSDRYAEPVRSIFAPGEIQAIARELEAMY